MKELSINLDYCSGCGLCESVLDGVKMTYDDEGYLRPNNVKNTDLDPIKIKLIEECCPSKKLSGKSSMGNYNLLWGVVEKSYSGFSNNEKERFSASSGGAISAIINWGLSTGYVDYVIQSKQSTDKPWQTISNIVKKQGDLEEYAGSRYNPSSPVALLKEARKTDGTFFFVGKPCDVYAAKKYVEHDKVLRSKVKGFISFFCAGVPSEKGSLKIIENSKIPKEDLTSFRYRGNGWPGETSLKSHSGEEYKITYEEAWGGILNRYLQPRCKLCADGIGEFADIVAADYWDCDDNGFPLFDEKGGESLILARSEIGLEIVDMSSKDKYLNKSEVDLVKLEKIQPYQVFRKKNLYSRMLGTKLAGITIPEYSDFGLFKLFLLNLNVTQIKSFFGSFKRGLKRNLNKP